mmetsp:Transcript_24545/g.77602  ORF Transcript_24545/g.77602 Transcript_24545/m.77602 type:complete len:215 (+) Transcript_24545:1490-2134(+)
MYLECHADLPLHPPHRIQAQSHPPASQVGLLTARYNGRLGRRVCDITGRFLARMEDVRRDLGAHLGGGDHIDGPAFAGEASPPSLHREHHGQSRARVQVQSNHRRGRGRGLDVAVPPGAEDGGHRFGKRWSRASARCQAGDAVQSYPDVRPVQCHPRHNNQLQSSEVTKYGGFPRRFRAPVHGAHHSQISRGPAQPLGRSGGVWLGQYGIQRRS